MPGDSVAQTTIVLGTAQFGMRYGLNETLLNQSAVDDILDAAWDAGIRTVDTARAYGEAEERIGRWMAQRQLPWTIVTKIPRHRGPRDETKAWINTNFDASRRALGVERVDILLAHNCNDFLEASGHEAFEHIRERQSARLIGASTYDVPDTHAVIDAAAGAIQFPASIADWRHAQILNDDTKAVRMVRSLYLQGALLMHPDALPGWLMPLRFFLQEIRTTAAALGLSQAAFVLAAARDGLNVRHFVLGFDARDQIEQAVHALRGPRLPDEALHRIRQAAMRLPAHAVDPRCWKH